MQLRRSPGPFLSQSFRFGLLIILFIASRCSRAEDGKGDSALSATPAEGDTPVACTNSVGSRLYKLSGVVTDPSGASIAHAKLTLTCGNFRVATTADASGAYSIAA